MITNEKRQPTHVGTIIYEISKYVDQTQNTKYNKGDNL